MESSALLVIDYQYDFVDPKGSLYVKGGELLKPYLLKLINDFKNDNQIVIASKDWHPINHCSFKKWPVHAVQHTKGSELMIEQSFFDFIVKKGYHLDTDSYSAFYDQNGLSNGLHEFLQSNQITTITIVGVALDICVNQTLIDAIKLNYHVTLDLKGCCGIKNQLNFN